MANFHKANERLMTPFDPHAAMVFRGNDFVAPEGLSTRDIVNPATLAVEGRIALCDAGLVEEIAAEALADDFDARFSAVQRHYVYRILVRRAPPVIERGRVWWVALRIDHEAMHAAAQALVGKHDFTTFRSSECQAKSPVKTLDRLDVSRAGDEVIVNASARSFLHNQVRSMVGTLKKVGEGRWPVSAVGEALAAADRARSGPVAPPDGLYLARVDY